MAMFDPNIPGGFKTPPIQGLAGEGFGGIGGAGALSTISAALLPMAGVNLLASAFGRKDKLRTAFLFRTVSDINRVIGAAGGGGERIRVSGKLSRTGGTKINELRDMAQGFSTIFTQKGFATNTEINQMIANARDFQVGVNREADALPRLRGKTSKSQSIRRRKEFVGSRMQDFIFNAFDELAQSRQSRPAKISAQPESQPKGIDKKQVTDTALKAAKNFLRFPTREPRAFRSSGFVSRAGYRDISELEQDVDRIIPSGFISKQPTTQSRALALRSLS